MTQAGEGQTGESLVELLLAVAIMGIAVVAVLGLMQLAVTASDIHHKEATAGTILDNFAEYMESQATDPFVACPAAATSYTAVAGSFATALSDPASKWYDPEYKPVAGAPARFTLSVTVAGGQAGTPDSNGVVDPSVVFPGGCTSDNGVQQLTLQVASTDTRASEVVSIVKRQP